MKMMAAAAVAGLMVAALALTRDPSARPSVALSAGSAASSSSMEVTVPPETLSRQVERDSGKSAPPRQVASSVVPSQADAPKAVAAKPTPVRDAQAVTLTATSTVAAAAPTPAPVTVVPDTVARPVAQEKNAVAPGLDASHATDAQARITITGCLETNGERFRLTETDGADAPKARGWRSGFLKRRPAAVELVAVSDPIALRKYVGHRVAATGVLDSRELQMRSFRPAGAMCD